MSKTVRVKVEPGLLTWARKSAGFSTEDAAGKVGITQERLEAWESGRALATVKQLRKLAAVCKRPLAVFCLPEPPTDFKSMHDFRRLPGEVAGVQSPQLRYEVRSAFSRRELATELYEMLWGTPPSFPLAAALPNKPAEVAIRIRQALSVTLEEQTSWRRANEAFRQWRARFENAGVLVFEAKDVPPTEMRGFAIAQRPLPAVVVNMKDSPAGRVFTLMHELVHVMLSQDSICDIAEEASRPALEERIEGFCNMTAGEALVPSECFLAEPVLQGEGPTESWSDDLIERLAGRYAVSREVIVRRLLACGRTTQRFYRRKRQQYIDQYKETRDRQLERVGFPPPHAVAINRVGPLFARVVLGNYHEGNITASDLSDYLGLRLKHLDKVEAALALAHSNLGGAL
jgi:Zn-dependent peptidase ImmA (M78 family)/DNA-binding XRE family transcriptional regulator